MMRFIIIVVVCFLGGCASQPAPATSQTPLANTGPASGDGQMQLGNFSVSLAVKDIAASRAFYEKLGFKQIAGDQAQNWLILQNSTSTTEENPEARTRSGTGPSAKGSTNQSACHSVYTRCIEVRRMADIDRFLPLSPQQFHILLALTDGPLHGYGVIRDVASRTKGRMQMGTGTLYTAVARLLALGLVAESKNAESPSRRRNYRLTTVGRRVLEAEALRLEALVSHARSMGVPRRLAHSRS
jgi:DNA-binding PadR family transcriptional regulator